MHAVATLHLGFQDALEALQEARDTVASVQEEIQQQQMQHHQQLLHQQHSLLAAAGMSNREVQARALDRLHKHAAPSALQAFTSFNFDQGHVL